MKRDPFRASNKGRRRQVPNLSRKLHQLVQRTSQQFMSKDPFTWPKGALSCAVAHRPVVEHLPFVKRKTGFVHYVQ